MEQFFLPIERCFEAVGTTDLYARVSLIGQPTSLTRGLGRYGTPQDGGTAIVLPIPSHQAKLAAAGVLRHLCVRTGHGGMIDRITFVDRPDNGGTMKQEQAMEFTKMQHDPNSTVPAHRPAANLSNTLICKSVVRHVEKVVASGSRDMPVLAAWLAKAAGHETPVDRLAEIRRDMEGLKARVMRKAATALAKIDPRFKELAASLDVRDDNYSDQTEMKPVAGGPVDSLTDDLGVGRKLMPPAGVDFAGLSPQQAIELAGELSKLAATGLTATQVEMANNSGRSLFAESYIAHRVAGISRRSITYAR